MQCSLAICIATYERPELIRDFLEKCAAYYAEAGVDVYFYDSSKSDETEKLVLSWPEQEHVFCVRLPSDMSLSEKELIILQCGGMRKKYDFISLSNDATQYSQAAITHLMEELDTKYDVVIYTYKRRRKVADPITFFNKCGVDSQHWGATFLNVKTLLASADWEKYESLFRPQTGLLEWASMGAYFRFYYKRFLELANFCALTLQLKKERTMRWTSGLKKSTIYGKDVMRCACEGWVYTFGELPAAYTKKWKVCRKAASGYFMAFDDFVTYRRESVFTKDILRRYWNEWEKVTNVPRPVLSLLAATPAETLKKGHERQKNHCLKKLLLFCKEHPRIILYGAGTNGYIISNYLAQNGIETEAFCTTLRKPEKTEFNGCPVKEVKELLNERLDDVGIVLAMRESGNRDALKKLRFRVKPDSIFYDNLLAARVREEMGYDINSGCLR